MFFPIVGVGASAGGLTAFQELISGINSEADPGMSFVLVQHLDPDHDSALSELLSHSTKLPVIEVVDNVKVSINCIYVIPSGFEIIYSGGHLKLLTPAASRGKRHTIDRFFKSLALELKEGSIGIILSGTGSDGTQGIKDIKQAGGLVLVQSSGNSEYPGMPESAEATGLVDYNFPAKELFPQLQKILNQGDRLIDDPAQPQEMSEQIKSILKLLQSQTGHDFSLYKSTTILRRIQRRLSLNKLSSLEDYHKYLQTYPLEVGQLFQDLLIGVTSFFRDPGLFTLLETQVIPQILDHVKEGVPIRCWSAGCSTGEEAYSLGMLLAEAVASYKEPITFQIFATDLDPHGITKARAGLFSAASIGNISNQRLESFFTKQDAGKSYKINKALRTMLIFSVQNVIKDPPFSKLDLICCRNLLIYLGTELQQKLLPLFHFALKPGGYLILGSSESIGQFSDRFETIDLEQKIFRKKETSLSHKRVKHLTPPLLVVKTEPVTLSNSLKTSNEEMQSINEELQSTNEELETSKEELQSVNDELTTANTALNVNISALSRSNNDMNNLLAGTGIATLFLDLKMQIVRFTPGVTKLINLIPGDIGRPLAHLVNNLKDYKTLNEDVKGVLETLKSFAIQVQAQTGGWFDLRILPYRTVENAVDGAAITFVDITEVRQMKDELSKTKEMIKMAAIVRDSRDAITFIDLKGNILAWNPGAQKLFGWTEAQALKMNIREMIPEDLRDQALAITHRLSQAEILEPYRTKKLTKAGKTLDVILTSTALIDEASHFYGISTTERAYVRG